MHDISLNAVSAAAIGAIIVAMADARNNMVKAIIYCLPIPITIVLLFTGGIITSNHILGLFLLNAFLWSVMLVYRLSHNIALADLACTIGYLVIGYGLVSYTSVGFPTIAALYALMWLMFVLLYGNRTIDEPLIGTPSRVRLSVKFVTVTCLSFVLLSMKSLFSGVIVTFPFSGIFAVVEGKDMLRTMAVKFTQNSMALLFLFVTIYAAEGLDLGYKISLGWLVYLFVFIVLNWIFRRQDSRRP